MARIGNKKRARLILAELDKAYPHVKCSLDYKNPIQLLVATILSAQCTDKRVNLVTPKLFKKYKKAGDYARALPGELEKAIQSTGFYRTKARNIRRACSDIASKYGGKVPNRLDDLVKLAGVGRKTANVVLGNAYDIPGIVVDTHVKRLSGRLGFTQHTNPVKIEFALMPIIPEKQWAYASHLLVRHGREYCMARKPNCMDCPVNHLCPSSGQV